MRTLSIDPTPIPSPAVLSSGAQRSPWHSPVPYLFGGLAAMLGLIAFALLILACSYLRLSERRESGEDRDLENGRGEKEGSTASKGSMEVYEEKILVIMAGEERPTFLATPVSAKIIPLNDGIGKDANPDGNSDMENPGEKTEKERSSNDQVTDQEDSIGETNSSANPEHEPS